MNLPLVLFDCLKVLRVEGLVRGRTKQRKKQKRKGAALGAKHEHASNRAQTFCIIFLNRLVAVSV
jgi:hypothetical protein